MQNDDWWNGDYSCHKRYHGNYNYRLPPKAFGTSEPEGYSMWHLLAIESLSTEVISRFLASAYNVSSDTILDDLSECMTVFPVYIEESWRENARLVSKNDYTWAELVDLTSWMNPLQICKALNKPLIIRPYPEQAFKLHPVVKAAQLQSLQNLKT